MDYQDFSQTIKRQILELPHNRQIELSLKICKKLFFDYHNFSTSECWGNSDFLLEGINLIEKALTGDFDHFKVKELVPKIDSIIPDMDNFDNKLSPYALNASASVYEALEFLIDNDKSHIINIATYYTDTADFKIQEEVELNQEAIDNHPLMIEARQFLLTETK